MWPHCVTLSAVQPLERLHGVLSATAPRIVACSGGVDSLLLADRRPPGGAATRRWWPTRSRRPCRPRRPRARSQRPTPRAGRCELVRSGEFADERYLSNPTDRCYFCKSHLYDAPIAARLRRTAVRAQRRQPRRPRRVPARSDRRRRARTSATRSSRPALGKADIRAVARDLGPRLRRAAGVAVPGQPPLHRNPRHRGRRLRAVEVGRGADPVRPPGRRWCAAAGATTRSWSRCAPRIGTDHGGSARPRPRVTMRAVDPDVASARLDDRPYRPGQAVLSLQ